MQTQNAHTKVMYECLDRITERLAQLSGAAEAETAPTRSDVGLHLAFGHEGGPRVAVNSMFRGAANPDAALLLAAQLNGRFIRRLREQEHRARA